MFLRDHYHPSKTALTKSMKAEITMTQKYICFSVGLQ